MQSGFTASEIVKQENLITRMNISVAIGEPWPMCEYIILED